MIKNLAVIITRIFDPITSITVYLTLILLRSDLSIQQKILFAPTIFLLGILFPGIYFFILLKDGKISDWDTTERKERFPLFSFTMACWTIIFLSTLAFGTPLFFRSFLTLYILGLFMAGITFFWKISVHATLFTLTAISLIFISTPKFWWIAFLIPIVLWSRFFLKKHTLAQLLAGSLLAIAVFFAIFIAP